MTAVDTTATGPLAMTELRSFDGADALRDEWDRLVVESDATVCLSFDHCAVWWSHYGAGRGLRVLVFRDGEGELAGVLPMFVERAWLGPVWLRRAALVGSDSTLVVHELPVRPAHAREVFATALGRLVAKERCDSIRFGPLCENTTHLEALRSAARDLGDAGRIVRDDESGPYTEFRLPASFDAYLSSLSKNHRGNYRRGMKTLREQYEVLADVVSATGDLDAEFERFTSMHAEQWQAEGKLGHFGDWPGSSDYHRDLVRAHGRLGRAHLVRLRLADDVVSYQLCYSVGSTLHWFLPARVARADLERHSLGRLGLVQMIEFAIASGFRRIEAGVGHYDYKLQLGGTQYAARSIVVARDGVVTSLRLKLYARLADALHFVYYKAWFQRLAPKLPLPRRPLWRLWIRSRL